MLMSGRAATRAVTGAMALLAFACSNGAAPTAPSTTPAQTQQTPPAATATPCTYTIANADRTRSVDAAGAAFTIPVSTQADCTWTANSKASFVTAALPSGTQGSGNVQVSVDANSGAARTGYLTVADQQVEISQRASDVAQGCSFAVSPSKIVARARGDRASVAISGSAACAWNAASSDAFLQISPASGTGDGDLVVDVAPNPGRERTGSVSVAGHVVTIVQDPTSDCATSVEASPNTFSAAGGAGRIVIASPSVCDWTAETADSSVALDSRHSGSGDGEVAFTLAANESTQTRTASIVVAGRTATITQAAGAPAPAPTPNPTPTPTPTPTPNPGPTPPPSAPSLPGPSSSAVSRFSFVSQPGDYVGAGRTRDDVAPAAVIDSFLEPSASELNVNVKAVDGSFWTLRIQAPAGRTLTPGAYDATRFPSSSTAGLSVVGESRGCSAATGRLVIYTADFDMGRRINRFDAAFEQHCEGGTAALIGEVVIAPPPVALPAPTPNPSSSSLSFVSDQGDYIGAGRTWSYAPPAATFTSDPSYGTTDVSVTVTSATDPGDWWTISFRAPPGGPLVTGVYEGATRWPFPSPSPLFSLMGNSRGCNTLTATFQVHQILYDISGVLQKFQATFEQHCEGVTAAARGEVVYIANPHP
ncbi:MAG TPA: BACON domain-containing protein [Vicinamibacterales bacterium]|nr:BACON domain-containing protein [Vicinamibacterales bacterium]